VNRVGINGPEDYLCYLQFYHEETLKAERTLLLKESFAPFSSSNSLSSHNTNELMSLEKLRIHLQEYQDINEAGLNVPETAKFRLFKGIVDRVYDVISLSLYYVTSKTGYFYRIVMSLLFGWYLGSSSTLKITPKTPGLTGGSSVFTKKMAAQDEVISLSLKNEKMSALETRLPESTPTPTPTHAPTSASASASATDAIVQNSSSQIAPPLSASHTSSPSSSFNSQIAPVPPCSPTGDNAEQDRMEIIRRVRRASISSQQSLIQKKPRTKSVTEKFNEVNGELMKAKKKMSIATATINNLREKLRFDAVTKSFNGRLEKALSFSKVSPLTSDSDSSTGTGKKRSSVTCMDGTELRISYAFEDIFLFGNKDIFFRAVELGIMLNCLYLAMWAVNFISIVEDIFRGAAWLQFVMLIPNVIVLPMLGRLIQSCSLLSAMSNLNVDVILRQLNDLEDTKSLVFELRQKAGEKIDIIIEALDGLGDSIDYEEIFLDIFNEIDVDRSGYVDQVEFRRLLRQLDLHLSEDRFKRLFRYADLDGGGHLEYEEVKSLLDIANKEATDKRKRGGSLLVARHRGSNAASIFTQLNETQKDRKEKDGGKDKSDDESDNED